jgi:alcohol dehydrogenase
MACGDPKAACRVAILDPDLTATQPPLVAAATAIDAVAHAVETAGTTKRTEVSLEFTRQAWQRLDAAFETAMRDPAEADARGAMLLGAHLAGAAIEHSMLGAAHACANPLTARLGTTHGVALGVLLPYVVRFNASDGENPYAALDQEPERLACRIETMIEIASLPRCLRDCKVTADLLPELADEAAREWTARFNPRPVAAAELHEVYQRAMG